MFLRMVFVAAFLAAAIAATTTARIADRQHGGPLNQLSHEVRGLVVARALLGLVFYAMLAAWLLQPARWPWAYLPVPDTARHASAVLLMAAVVFLAWSYRALGANYRGGVGLYERHVLVMHGPYRVMRHPIYLAFLLIMLLLLPLTANWVLGVSGLVLVGMIAVVRIPIEDAQLAERFGAQWHEYRQHTGVFWPRTFTG